MENQPKENHSQPVLAIAIFFLTLSSLCVGLRVYVRSRLLKSFGLDDWTMVLTQLLFTMYIACQIGGVRYGTGRHHADLPREDAVAALRYWYFCEVFYILTSVFLKISIGIFLLRIAASKIHVWIVRLVMASTSLFGAMYVFLIIFQCKPISQFWNVNPGGPGCLNTNVIIACTYTAGALNATADWTFGILPFFIVWDLKMTNKAKGLVAGILAFAAIGSTGTVIRIPYVKGLKQTDDFLYTTLGIAIWSTVEPGIGIAAGCIATFRPLMRNFLWRIGVGSMPASSGMSYGKHTHSRRAPSRNLDELELHRGVQTMITGNDQKYKHNSGWNKGGSSSRESDEIEVLKDGISKHVVVEYEESRLARTPRGKDYTDVHSIEGSSTDGPEPADPHKGPYYNNVTF
ncbi:hypothetical protein EJ05DRAFT_511533 [Pseudovirgaria hyperparasitica]|uniref:Rhodopsin domain-containing protein n=1 Tax=Pseudovirgaria hyperparasitica TaxID=470096 RepID=A0A6A6W5E4_9PEZI|nr:uncharacterized protein EJ05DRAFT_511533 [Pseudovirgaria hyperparasitica]KAF2757765.1 hypothetical protein EJ05DRAFT_511533 [Pseudovirgaria hyperparasitica]